MADRYRIRAMPRASNDIVGICSYIEKDSPQNAAKVAQVLLDAIDSLEIFPHRYTVHEHRKDAAKTVYAHAGATLHRVLPGRRAEQHRGVLTILHGHRKQPRRFK